jgi:integrating conjugative element protein (TIGR03765 family)
MTPGELTHRIIRAPGITPFFLVGDDGRSRRWLSTHAAVLRQLGAVGFIVHVDTIPALAAVRALVPGVTVVPASADDLADRLKISHYPALVTATGIEQ